MAVDVGGGEGRLLERSLWKGRGLGQARLLGGRRSDGRVLQRFLDIGNGEGLGHGARVVFAHAELRRARCDAGRLVAGHAAPQRAQRQLGDLLESLEDARAGEGHGLAVLETPFGVECVQHHLDGGDIGQIPLVELQDERQLVQVHADLGEVLAEVLQTLHVRLQHRHLGVGHEDDAVNALEHELAGGVVEDLSRDCVELQAGLEPADDADVDGQQVEEEGAVGLRFQTDHLPAAARGGLRVDVVQVGRLPAETRTVVNDLRGHLHGCVVEEDHRCSDPRGQGC